MNAYTERTGMKRLAVEEIIIPIKEDVGLKPSVGPEDRITEALEVMLKNDLKRIAVSSGKEVLGMITLEDALKQVGLEGDLKSKESRSVIIHGRRIVVE
ncbi:MAG: CBS domain-containing protein [Deltaproteobacteria bacterium]|nr:CBS domain-containing protein [Deltaproteobacteria bacterium]